MATTPQRTHMAALMRWLLEKEPQIHYRQRRPMSTRFLTEQELFDHFSNAANTIATDCSETVTMICRFAGLADPNGFDYNGAGYCHEPSARLLTRDLRWKPAGDVQVGDVLWALDEDPNGGHGRARGRRYRVAIVTASWPSKKDCVRVCLDTGEALVCSTDHPWLTIGESTRNHMWMRAAKLHERPGLVRPFLPWTPVETYETGWLSGMFDGEGWVSNRYGRAMGVAVTQAVGPTATRLVELAQKYGGFHVRTVERPDVKKRLEIESNGGGLSAAAAFLGTIRPERLIHNFNLEGTAVQANHAARVVGIESLGEREIQNISTTTGTYIAEGFAVHNTGTMLAHLPHYTDPSLANVGALVVFVRPELPTGDHVAMVLTPGRDPWLFSHGSEEGPKRRRLSTEAQIQRQVHGASSQPVFLNISKL